MLAELDSVAWASFAQPERNAPDAIPHALRLLARATTADEGNAAYTRYPYAIEGSEPLPSS